MGAVVYRKKMYNLIIIQMSDALFVCGSVSVCLKLSQASFVSHSPVSFHHLSGITTPDRYSPFKCLGAEN
ncbi:hypothetical protein F2Q70_00030887 [Brassica cretica]|uniref:Uncharacterized protein n=1 Tax=Brassica cretica TaxID=69181 RepID=A0A8S9FLS9_BRACR|nr:hypothetical protein F2Q70_00030887 [Brassica cretica]KAF3591383.1 hypothetical protein DY000_02023556 [Brassica cretica]